MLGKKTGGRIKGVSRNKPKVPTVATTPVAAAVATAGGGGAPPAELFSPRARASAREAKDPAFPKYRVVAVASLIPYANNARTHTPDQIRKIASSIREFGFTNPVLTDGKRGIVAGHGRVLAASLLAMETVPVIELSHLSKAQRRAYVIADNRLALDAGWDDELLALELGELRDDGFDLSLTGFDAGELSSLFGGDGEGEGGGSGAGSLAAQFGIPPFSVLNAREGWWQDRKRAWLALGIQSEIGRGDTEANTPHTGKGMADGLVALRADQKARKADAIPGGAGKNSVVRDMGKRLRANATPGGAKLPAANYGKTHARGDGRGRAVA